MRSTGWFDEPLFDAVNGFARSTGWLHAPMTAYAGYGLVVFAVLLVTGWWLSRHRGPRSIAAALWAAAATVLAVALNQLLVGAFAQSRPYTDLTDILVLAQRSSDYSFPSDHAVMAGAAAAGLFLVSRRLGTLAAAAAALMAFARVYIAAHYPHDVAAGLLFGAAVTLTGWWLLARPLTTLTTRLTATPLRPLLTAKPPATTTRPAPEPTPAATDRQ